MCHHPSAHESGAMTRVIIPAVPEDGDVIAVAAAIRLMGHECDIWYQADYPQQELRTLSFGAGTDVEVRGREDSPRNWLGYDVCWLRDLHPPFVDYAHVHPDDCAFVRHASERYFRQAWSLLSSPTVEGAPAFWANSLDSARRAESKPLQLHLAGLAGFQVPPTLISNDIDRIRSFIRASPGKVIRKSLFPHFWNEDDVSVTNRTSYILEDDLPSDRAVRLYAEIYQAEVEKVTEVRVVFFGRTYAALEISPGKEKGGRFVDWRIYHVPGLAQARRIEIPEEIFGCCQRIMKKLGIVTASFDFLVDARNQYWFAELNQGGLFLWMEKHGIPTLEMFANFLINKGEAQSESSLSDDRLTLRKVQYTTEFEQLAACEARHLVPPRLMDNKDGAA